jgi:hypothetical protein
VTVTNTGTQPVTLNTITVAPVGSECATPSGIFHGQRMAPLCFTGSAVFLVQNDGSLKSVSVFVMPPVFQRIFSGFGQHGRESNSTTPSTGSQPNAYPGSTGYTLAPGKSVTLTYSGSIGFGFAFGLRTPPGVLSGDQYQITAVGQEALAETVVVAG